jgi:hypothetical protein
MRIREGRTNRGKMEQDELLPILEAREIIQVTPNNRQGCLSSELELKCGESVIPR